MLKYPIIPSNPKTGDKIFAFVTIEKNSSGVYSYILHEPILTEKLKKSLKEIKEYIEEKVDIDFAQLRKIEAIKYVEDVFEKALDYFKIKRGTDERNILHYFIVRDFVGLGNIDSILKDPNLEDISCDGINIPLYVYHRDPRLGSLKTNIAFTDKDELNAFVERLSERCGKSISVSSPLLDGTLPDGSRVQATLGTDIARHGSNFTIRMFTENPLTPIDIIKSSTVDTRMMAFLWLAVEYGHSILISGGTATGKTSLLNAISLFIKPEMKIVSIEDTAELRLTHDHWVPEVARVAISEESTRQVDMYELLRESLRQRPDYIIVGEVRGKEAYVLFQQIAVGHPGLATIHAENFSKLVDRLTTPPISLPANLIENLDVLIFLERLKLKNRYTRKVNSVSEVIGYSRKYNKPYVNEIFEWEAKNDIFKTKNPSTILKKISDKTGMSDAEISNDIIRRVKVLKWMENKNIRNYKDVSMIINMFYTRPEDLIKKIEGYGA
ncbi:MAG: type II/IV secretion system ATPase subunit [Candidatus Aenigmarchaeota archaeon]|nr:type II/IV secretion system ATPase subunit [Candidatus Aenigmarchaeota archaeon]